MRIWKDSAPIMEHYLVFVLNYECGRRVDNKQAVGAKVHCLEGNNPNQ